MSQAGFKPGPRVNFLSSARSNPLRHHGRFSDPVLFLPKLLRFVLTFIVTKMIYHVVTNNNVLMFGQGLMKCYTLALDHRS